MRRRPSSTTRLVLAEVVRDVVEGRVELVADALHRGNGGNSDQRGNQAVLDGGRTLRIFDQLQELGHFRSPTDSNATLLRPLEVHRMTGISRIAVYQPLKNASANMNFG